MKRFHALPLLLASTLLAAPAFAQSATRNATIAPGKPARLAVVTNLKRDCSFGETGTIRITSPGKNGNIAVRTGKATTPASFHCPNKETPVQALFYQPNDKFTGTDEISYETRSADGATQTVTVKITITDKPGAAPAAKSDVLDL